MISNAYLYNNDFQERINAKISSEGFCSDSWSDNDISDIKESIKQFYIPEQNHICPYCQQRFLTNNGRQWDIEHIIPRQTQVGFMFTPQNLCVCCPDCNSHKGYKKTTTSVAKKTPPTKSHLYLIVHPHFDKYDDHIEVIEPGYLYRAKSKKGENTMYVCSLNRFYQFSGYNSAVATDHRLMMLANGLSSAQSEEEKRQIRREMISISLRANI